MMEVTIIIPVYNRAAVVPATLESVVAQTHRPLQVVLVDNYSTDNTLQVLETFKKEHPGEGFNVEIVREDHHTAGAARNRGFEKATGEWVLFFDSDDLMKPGLVASYTSSAPVPPSSSPTAASARHRSTRATCLPTTSCTANWPPSAMP